MIRMTKRKKRKKTTKHFLPQKHSQSIDFFFFIFHICEKIKFLHKNVSSLWRCVSAFLFFFTWEFRFGLRCDKSEVFEEEERRKWHLQTKLNRKEMRTRMKRLDCQTININRLWRDIKKQFPVLNSLQMKEDGWRVHVSVYKKHKRWTCPIVFFVVCISFFSGKTVFIFEFTYQVYFTHFESFQQATNFCNFNFFFLVFQLFSSSP